jgi:hypothetical protein
MELCEIQIPWDVTKLKQENILGVIQEIEMTTIYDTTISRFNETELCYKTSGSIMRIMMMMTAKESLNDANDCTA